MATALGLSQKASVIDWLNQGQPGNVQTDVQNLPIDPTRLLVNLLISLRRDGWWCFYKGMNPAPGHHFNDQSRSNPLSSEHSGRLEFFGDVQTDV